MITIVTLLFSVAAIKKFGRKTAFLFPDLNVPHREWYRSASHTDVHGLAALGFANLCERAQIVHKPTYISGSCLDPV